jgi:hypothetical protein
MKVGYTDEALNDLAAIADWLMVHYPTVAPVVEQHIRLSLLTLRGGRRARAAHSAARAFAWCRSAATPTRPSIVLPPIPSRYSTSIMPRGGLGMKTSSGADLTFATQQATISQSERQIQSSTRINVLLVVL